MKASIQQGVLKNPANLAIHLVLIMPMCDFDVVGVVCQPLQIYYLRNFTYDGMI